MGRGQRSLEQAGRHASRIEMMQDGNKSRSKCGVMLALGGCCAVRSLVCCAALGMSRRSVGRSVDSLFWRAGVIRLFPSPFPLTRTRPAQDPREKQVSLCQLAAPWQLLSGSGSTWALFLHGLEPSGIATAGAAPFYPPTLQYVPAASAKVVYLRHGSGCLGRYLCIPLSL